MKERPLQAGRVGFLKALRSYDPLRGTSIGSYASSFIVGEMFRDVHGLSAARSG